jgi:hypothetical protein
VRLRAPRWPALLGLLAALGQSACASNMLGREVRVEAHPYAFRGEQRTWWSGTPVRDAPDDLPIAIFLEDRLLAAAVAGELGFEPHELLPLPRSWSRPRARIVASPSARPRMDQARGAA